MSDIDPKQRGPGRPSNEEMARRTVPNAPPPTAQRPPEHIATSATVHETARDPVHEKPRVRTRQSRATVHDDPYFIPKEEIPEGSSYEWKRWTNVGQEDPFYIAAMRRQGWEPVDPRAHPNWVPPGYSEPYLIRAGQILMERPIELTREARAEQHQLARQQMREAEQRLGMTPKDTLTRQHPGIEPRVVKEYGRMVVEE